MQRHILLVVMLVVCVLAASCSDDSTAPEEPANRAPSIEISAVGKYAVPKGDSMFVGATVEDLDGDDMTVTWRMMKNRCT